MTNGNGDVMNGKISVLGPVHQDLERVEKILQLLDEERDLPTRADLGEELVRECSILEDTNERSLYPYLEGLGYRAAVERIRAAGSQLREALEPVYSMVHNSVPMDVHTNNADAFEHSLEQLCSAIDRQLRVEVDELTAIEQTLGNEERADLRAGLDKARQDAVDEPHPPSSTALRSLRRLMGKIDRHLPRTGEQYRPGREKLGED